ncbi:MAG TPA: glycosyltransferase, partial [Longimicrobium sp.]|nr:glycosyltransferase [Longimicrobium sp.]
APENAIGAVRLSKFAKYLIRQGHTVTVISPELDADTRLDPSLDCAEFAALKRHVVPQSGWFRRFVGARRKQVLATTTGASLLADRPGGGMRGRLKALVFRNVQFGYTLLRNHDWKRQVLRYVRAHLRHERFDVVLSSYPSLGAMWAARQLRRSGVAPRWVADFRDRVNYSTNSTPLLYRLNTGIQARLVRAADQVVAVSEGMGARITRGPSDKREVISNGFDPDDLRTIGSPRPADPDRRVLTLAYAGSLYGGERDMTVVFQALRRLVDEGVARPGEVELVYAGKDFGVLRRQAAQAGMEDILVDRGYVDRVESLRMQRDADLVVVVTWNTPDDVGVLSGKLYECFLMRKPVVGVVNGTQAHSEFRAVVERVNGGIVYESATPSPEADFERLCAFLRDRLRERLEDGALAEGYRDVVEEYSYDHLAGRLHQLF